MNKKLILIIVGAVVLLGGVGGYLLMNRDDNTINSSTDQNQDTPNQDTPSADQGQEAEVQGNLQTLRNDGTPRQCTMSYTDSARNGTGKMYTDGQGRGLMSLEVKTERGNTGQTNTLITNDKVYSWTKTDGGSIGMVLDASAIQPHATGSPTTSSTQAAGKDFTLKCKAWNVDEAVLAIPTDVTFTNMPTIPSN